MAADQLPDVIEPSLVDKVLELHRRFSAAGVVHAFGGALALAYYTNEPRATADIDVNVAVDPVTAAATLATLPQAISWDDASLTTIERDEQIRLWWGRTPLDLFFRASTFHDGVAQRAVGRPFAHAVLPFLAADDLAVFKSLFNRPKDWLDIEAMAQAGSVDVETVVQQLIELIGDDERVERLRSLAP